MLYVFHSVPENAAIFALVQLIAVMKRHSFGRWVFTWIRFELFRLWSVEHFTVYVYFMQFLHKSYAILRDFWSLCLSVTVPGTSNRLFTHVLYQVYIDQVLGYISGQNHVTDAWLSNELHINSSTVVHSFCSTLISLVYSCFFRGFHVGHSWYIFEEFTERTATFLTL